MTIVGDSVKAFRTDYLPKRYVGCPCDKDKRPMKHRQTERQTGRMSFHGVAQPNGKTQLLKNHTWNKDGVVASKFQTHYWRHCRFRRRIHTSCVISHGEVHVHAQLPTS